jgi:phosphate transport system permease protein
MKTHHRRTADFIQRIMFALITSATFSVVIFLFVVLGYIFYKGAGTISLPFLTEMPRQEMTAGGIMPAIMGTMMLMLGAMLISVPVGIITAVYIVEYATNARLVV